MYHWKNLGDKALKELGAERNIKGNADKIAKQLPKRLSDQFIDQHYWTFIYEFFKPGKLGEKYLESIVESLINKRLGPKNYKPKSLNGYYNFIDRTIKSKSCRDTLRHILKEVLQKGLIEQISPENIPAAFKITPAKIPYDDRTPFDYQEKVWKSLDKATKVKTAPFAGLVVMPTGSGKTFTSVHWLLKNHVANGGKVLWIAHRYELLEQAATNFATLGHLVDGKKETLDVRIVSGRHSASSTINPSFDDITIAMPYFSKTEAILEKVVKTKNLFVVIDEAHHAYRAIGD